MLPSQEETKTRFKSRPFRKLEAIGVKAIYSVFDDAPTTRRLQTSIKTIIEEVGIELIFLVNNAGIAAFGTLNEMEVSQWSQIIQTNVMGNVLCDQRSITTLNQPRTKETLSMYHLQQD